MNSLIIGACFVVAVLALVGLFLSLRESTPTATASTEAPVEKKDVPPIETKKTVQLDGGTSLPATSEQPDPDSVSYNEQQPEHDADEIDYAELPTIRSIAHYGNEGRDQSSGQTDQLQVVLEELRNLNQQMQYMEQRISRLSTQVEDLKQGDARGEKWDASSPTLKVPAQ